MTDPVTVEGKGETIGEAKWAALRELERRFPGLDRHAVSFQVLAEGERGLMGIGREPARVLATLGEVPLPGAVAPVSAGRPEGRPSRPSPPLGAEATGEDAVDVREIVTAVASGMGLDARVHVVETAEAITATITGADLGVVIGRHGRTIDAIQYLVNAIRARNEGATPVVVDAQNYRHRREQALHETADRAARDAVRDGRPVPLEPMTSVERKIVHLYLKERPDVETASDGREPLRHIVVAPRSAEDVRLDEPGDLAEPPGE